MEIIFSKTFKKQAIKLIQNRKNLKEKINECIIDFAQNIRSSRFYRKRLKGNLKNFEELQIGGDLRILIRMSIQDQMTVFEQIGTHSDFGW
ncbi:hypothetical protein COB57_00135 [Candidatus Peregrinibacteria bacterium]|nr:MAG: hypothetical protein COB57_00135 [Candidatus Peregrinibacteria bacterium]